MRSQERIRGVICAGDFNMCMCLNLVSSIRPSDTLQHTETTRCITPQHTCSVEGNNNKRNDIDRRVACCNTLPHTETTRCITPQHTCSVEGNNNKRNQQTGCSLQHIAAQCNTLPHTATHYNSPQHTVTHCNNTLHHTATHLQCRG